MKVSEYLSLRGLKPEELSALLSERIGRSIAVGAVIARGDSEIPKSWAKVLDDIPPEVDVVAEAEAAGAKPPPDKRKQQTAPKPVAEFNPMLAEERVAAIYAMVGKGVATAAKEPRYEHAFKTHADQIGKAWTELAKHDKHVATVLTMLTTGGPWGEVVWLHLSLGFSLVVISGKVEIGSLGGIVPGQAKPAAPQDGNGASGTGAPDSVEQPPS